MIKWHPWPGSAASPHFKGIPGVGTLTARGLAGGDLQGLGGHAHWALDLQLLVLGTLDQVIAHCSRHRRTKQQLTCHLLEGTGVRVGARGLRHPCRDKGYTSKLPDRAHFMMEISLLPQAFSTAWADVLHSMHAWGTIPTALPGPDATQPSLPSPSFCSPFSRFLTFLEVRVMRMRWMGAAPSSTPTLLASVFVAICIHRRVAQ